MATFAATLSGVERVEVLPFHQLGANKWAELNLPYQLADVARRRRSSSSGSRTSSGPTV